MNQEHFRQRSTEKNPEDVTSKGNLVQNSFHQSPNSNCKKFSNKKFNNNKGAKIIIHQLPITVTEESLVKEIKKFGFVKKCTIIKRKPNTFNTGFVLMRKVANAKKAISFINLNYKWNASLMSHKIDECKHSSSPNLRNKEKEKLIDQSSLREICIINIPHNISKELIYSYFFVYGEIEGIDMHEKEGFAFIKFFTTASAKLAFKQGNNSNVENLKINIKYSDYNQRKDIIGNKLGYNYDCNTCKTLVVCYSKSINLPNQNIISRIFSNYGQVKAIYLKHCLPKSDQKPKIYIDFDKANDARKMLEFFKNPEIHQTICYFLLDVNILIIPLVNLYPELRINQDLSSVLQNFKMQNVSLNLFQMPINKDIHSSEIMKKNNSEDNILICQSFLPNPINTTDLLSTFSPINWSKNQNLVKSSSASSILNQINSVPLQQSISLQKYVGEPKKEEKVKEKANQLLNDEEPYSLKSKSSFEDLNLIWSGFITKKNRNRVGVDAFLIKGNIADSLIDYTLNISHKIDLTFFNNNLDASGILIFAPSNETQLDIFNKYLTKLLSNQKAGAIPLLHKNLMYVIPPCNTSKKFFYCSKMHLLGLFFSSNIAPL